MISLRERVPVAVLHDKASAVFFGDPGRLEAAGHPGILGGTYACRQTGTPGAIFDIISRAGAADGVNHAARTSQSTNVEEFSSSYAAEVFC
jgi:hypothetical protein